jgi:2-aminoethylphosphonate-pyruvate transaminase
LTTAAAVRQAALVDWGSWDTAFTALTAQVISGLLQAAEVPVNLTNPQASDTVCIPLQGSGTFAVEAAVRTFVPADAGLVVAVNGAYGRRLAHLSQLAGRQVKVVETPWNEPVEPQQLVAALQIDQGIKHIAVIHCETSTGLLNPLPEILDAAEAAGGQVIVDAMSSFGALPVPVNHPACAAVVASSGKCLEGLPGVGFVFTSARQISQAAGQCDSLSLDLADQFSYWQRTGQWRFTPPTHLVAALAVALQRFAQEGGRPARLARFQANSQALAEAAQAIGLKAYLPASLQAPIIHTFFAPPTANWSFSSFYNQVKTSGFIIYPGKLTEEETFRVGCIGQVTPATMRSAVAAIAAALPTAKP